MRISIYMLGMSICSAFFLVIIGCSMFEADLGVESGGDAGDLDGDGDSDSDSDSDGDSDSDYADPGNLVWAKKIGSLQDVECRTVVALADDSLILAGGFEATATFGAGESAETSLTTAGITDVFIAKYNDDGTVAWAKRAGSSGDDGNDQVQTHHFVTGDSADKLRLTVAVGIERRQT